MTQDDEGWTDLDGTPMPAPTEPAPAKTEPKPYRYEDQYGNERWSDTNEKT